jgi:hypothetical protein
MAGGENLAGVLESGSRNHCRARERDRKREKLKANSPEVKTWPRTDLGRRAALKGGTSGPVNIGDTQ